MVDAWQLLFAALVISLDSFAAAVALGVLGLARRILRIAATFAVVGAASPLAGLWLGTVAADRLAGYGEWIGSVVLLAFGLWLLWHMDEDAVEQRVRRAATPWGLLLLALSLSADNLVIGIGLGLHGVAPLPLFVVVAVFVFVSAVIGVRLGSAAHRRLERWTAGLAGVVLIALAVFIAPIWGN